MGWQGDNISLESSYPVTRTEPTGMVVSALGKFELVQQPVSGSRYLTMIWFVKITYQQRDLRDFECRKCPGSIFR